MRESHLERLVVKPSTLRGQVTVSGAKNSALRLLAATILTPSAIDLGNFPVGLLDVQVQLTMLRALGKRLQVSPNRIVITEESPPVSVLEYEGRSIRNTLLVLGALVARTGAGSVPLPGGCNLGERKHDLHVLVLESLGARVWESEGRLSAEAPNGLRGAEIVLPIRSTGATENAILASSLACGVTQVWNPHVRPEILDLIDMLRAMGARIDVRGQESIVIAGVDALGGTKHSVIPDSVEALTWLVGSVVTGGDVEILGFRADHLEVPLIHLRESGVRVYLSQDRAIVRGGAAYPIDIATGPYPGINSDMQPILAVLGAKARGESRITDLRFPGRFTYAEEFRRLGIDCEVVGDMLRLRGGKPLTGAEVRALDLRCGAALVLAGLTAEGETVVSDAWQIGRGYERFLEKAQGLGGAVKGA